VPQHDHDTYPNDTGPNDTGLFRHDDIRNLMNPA